MAPLLTTSNAQLNAMWTALGPQLRSAPALESVLQQVCASLYGEYRDSLVLVRTYLTIPFGKLPARNQAFVRALVTSQRVDTFLLDTTPVLSLVGTAGRMPNWNDRLHSVGHVGIPLLSSAFVNSIPMVARLLQAVGGKLDWFDQLDVRALTQTLGSLYGTFYVPDARTAVDANGRKVIAAQDFVSAYEVKTVFGVGSSYTTTGDFLALLLFSHETLPSTIADAFVPFVTAVKLSTTVLLESGKVFAI